MFVRYLIPFMILIFSAPLYAQAPSPELREQARVRFDEGRTAFAESRWEDCAHSFEESFALIFAPELLYNAALCYQRAAESLPDTEARPLLERGLSAYQRYLREIPNASDADEVRRVVVDLQGRLLRMAPRVEIVTVPVPPPLPVSETEVASEEGDEVEPNPFTLREPERRARGDYTGTILSGVTAVVSFVAALGLGIHAQDLYGNLSRTCGQQMGGCSPTLIREVESFSLAANFLYGVAGVAVVGAGIAFGFEFTATVEDTRGYASVSGRF